MVDVDTSLVLGKPEMSVHLDRAKAAELGIQVADVATTLQLMVGGKKISDYNEGGEQYEVHARALPSWRTDADGLRQMAVPSARLGAVSLDHVARFSETAGPSQIDRYARRRQVTVTANMLAGHSQGAALAALETEVKALNLDPSYSHGTLGHVEGDGSGGDELHPRLPSLVRLHVPDPGRAVRVVAAPDHDPALAAADGAVRAAVAASSSTSRSTSSRCSASWCCSAW